MSCFSEVFQHSSDWRWRPLVFSRKIAKRFLFPLFLLKAIYGVISLALCPHILLQIPQHFGSTEITCEGLLCPPVYLLGHTGSFEGGCRPLTHASPGCPFHFSIFVASGLNVRGGWHVWSDCNLLSQSIDGNVWCTASKLRPHRLHCLRGIWSSVVCLTLKLHQYHPYEKIQSHTHTPPLATLTYRTSRDRHIKKVPHASTRYNSFHDN